MATIWAHNRRRTPKTTTKNEFKTFQKKEGEKSHKENSEYKIDFHHHHPSYKHQKKTSSMTAYATALTGRLWKHIHAKHYINSLYKMETVNLHKIAAKEEQKNV